MEARRQREGTEPEQVGSRGEGSNQKLAVREGG